MYLLVADLRCPAEVGDPGVGPTGVGPVGVDLAGFDLGVGCLVEEELDLLPLRFDASGFDEGILVCRRLAVGIRQNA